MLKRNYLIDSQNKKNILTFNNEQLNKTLTYIENNSLIKKSQKTRKKNLNEKPLNIPIQNKRKSNSLSPLKNRIKQIKKSQIKSQKIKQKLLVIDLDETLVHSSFDYFENPDLILNINLEEEEDCKIYINIRPGAKEFIEELSNYFEIRLFTASSEQYANELINLIDVKKKISSKLFRNDCTIEGDLYIKDLRKMDKELKDIIIIDNNIKSFIYQQENGIPIKSWYDDYNDLELFKLIPILKNLEGFYDVRTEIKKFVNNNTFIWMKGINWLKENMLCSIFDDELNKVLEMEKKNCNVDNYNNIYNCSFINNNNINIMDNNNNKNCRNYVMKDFSKKFNLNRRSPKKSLGQSNNLITNSCNDFIKITNNFFFENNYKNNSSIKNNNNNPNIKIEDENNEIEERLNTDGNENLNNYLLYGEKNNDKNLLKRSSSLKKKHFQFQFFKGNIKKIKGLKIKKVNNKINMNTNTLFNLFKKSRIKNPNKEKYNGNNTTNFYKSKKIYDYYPSGNNSMNNSKNFKFKNKYSHLPSGSIHLNDSNDNSKI